MTKLKTKLMTIFVSLLVLSLSITLLVSAAMPTTGYWCDTYTGGVCDEGAFPEGYVKLTGSDEHKAIAQARTDDDVKALKKEILADGYTPLGNGEIAGTMDVNGTELLVVTFSFKPKNGNGNETAEITYIYNAETGDTIVIRTGFCWSCIFAIAAIRGVPAVSAACGACLIPGEGAVIGDLVECFFCGVGWIALSYTIGSCGCCLSEYKMERLLNNPSFCQDIQFFTDS